MFPLNDGSSCACTLDAGARQHRIRAWRELAQRSLHRELEPGRVVSTYASTPENANVVKSLIDAEAECCSFLTFAVSEQDGLITVETRFPVELGAVVDCVLTPQPPERESAAAVVPGEPAGAP